MGVGVTGLCGYGLATGQYSYGFGANIGASVHGDIWGIGIGGSYSRYNGQNSFGFGFSGYREMPKDVYDFGVKDNPQNKPSYCVPDTLEEICRSLGFTGTIGSAEWWAFISLLYQQQSLKCVRLVKNEAGYYQFVYPDTYEGTPQMILSDVINSSYKLRHEKLKVILSDDLFSVSSSLEISERRGSLFSFQIKHADGSPLDEGLVVIEGDSKRKWMVMETGCDGYIDTLFLRSFLNSEVLVGTYLNVNESDMRQRIILKRGFDYEMISNIPSSLICGICKKEKVKFDMAVFDEDILEFVFEFGGFSRESCCSSKLIRISGCQDMPADYCKKHIGNILVSLLDCKSAEIENDNISSH